MEKTKKWSFPSAQTILFIIAGLVAMMTWFIPAGKYDTLKYSSEDKVFIRTAGGTQITLPANQSTLDELGVAIPMDKFANGDINKPIGIPNTYHEVESNPQGIFDFLQSPIKGIVEASDIIFLVLIIGGLIGIMNETGAFSSGIVWLSEILKGREYWLIIFTTLLIALGGTTFGLAEETLAFLPILIPVFIAAKYDALVGLSCVFLGSSVGAMCSTTNPFSTIIASDSAGIQWTTGLGGRVLMLAICLFLTLVFILRYARKIKKDPTKSLLYNSPVKLDFLKMSPSEEVAPLNARMRIILFLFMSCFVVMIIGVSKLDWWFMEMTSVFLVGAILIGFVAKIKEVEFITFFSRGAGELLGVAFIIGIARGVSILMNDGMVSDTVLNYASMLTAGMNKGLFVNTLFFVYNGLSFLIPSSSGMAVLTMPIMSPLANTVGIGNEVIVNAYQYGQGMFAIINPTGLVLASLGVVKIGYDTWLKFIWPLVLVLTVTVMIVLTVTVL